MGNYYHRLWICILLINNKPNHSCKLQLDNGVLGIKVFAVGLTMSIDTSGMIVFELHAAWASFTNMGLLPDTQNCGLRVHRECRERFPATSGWRSRHASRHVRDGIPGILGACATPRNVAYLVRSPWFNFNTACMNNYILYKVWGKLSIHP